MSQPSNWPLPEAGKRLLTPAFMRTALGKHPLTKDCLPTALGFYPTAQGHFMSREQHDDDLVMLCAGGRGTVCARGDKITVKAGDAVLLPSGTPHRYQADLDEPWTIYWVHFCGTATADLLTHLGAPALLVIHPGLDPSLITGFQQLLEVARTGYQLPAYLTAANRLRLLLIQMADLHARAQREDPQEFSLSGVQQLMRSRITGHLTLDEIAAAAGVSKSYCARRYRELTGYAPVRHFTHMKMEAACRVLDSGDQSIKQVATIMGYDDPLYFSRVFSRVVGLSPSEYRRAISG